MRARRKKTIALLPAVAISATVVLALLSRDVLFESWYLLGFDDLAGAEKRARVEKLGRHGGERSATKLVDLVGEDDLGPVAVEAILAIFPRLEPEARSAVVRRLAEVLSALTVGGRGPPAEVFDPLSRSILEISASDSGRLADLFAALGSSSPVVRCKSRRRSRCTRPHRRPSSTRSSRMQAGTKSRRSSSRLRSGDELRAAQYSPDRLSHRSTLCPKSPRGFPRRIRMQRRAHSP